MKQLAEVIPLRTLKRRKSFLHSLEAQSLRPGSVAARELHRAIGLLRSCELPTPACQPATLPPCLPVHGFPVANTNLDILYTHTPDTLVLYGVVARVRLGN